MSASAVHICPFCQEQNPAGAVKCFNCGRSLTLACPRCSTVNPVEAVTCVSCGARLDVLSRIMAREEMRTGDRFARMAKSAAELKAADADTLRRQSEQLWEEEKKRQADLAEQGKHQKQKERDTLIVVAIAAAVIIIVVVALVVLTGP